MTARHVQNTFGLKAIAAITVSMLMGWGAAAHAQPVYKCTNAAGATIFSDKVCAGALSVEDVRPAAEADLPQRKAEHDATVSRDKALANQVEANRLANEQAARAAQDQQVQASKALQSQMEQQRAQKNATVVSDPSVTQTAPTVTAP